MFRIIYLWMVFQVLIGIWLFISPFIFGFRDLLGASTNNMLFGAIIVVLGVGVWLYEFYGHEAREFRELEQQRS